MPEHLLKVSSFLTLAVHVKIKAFYDAILKFLLNLLKLGFQFCAYLVGH